MTSLPEPTAIPAQAAPFIDATMVLRRVVLEPRDMVFVRGVLEASDGVAMVCSASQGELVFAAFASRELELEQILVDLSREVEGLLLSE